MLKGHVFAEQIFTHDGFAHIINTFMNGHHGVTKGCELEHTSNSVTIKDGFILIYGRPIQEIGGSTLNITNATEYCKLVCEVDMSQVSTASDFQQAVWKILRGTIDYPSLIQQDLSNGGTIYQLEFAMFQNTPSGIVNFVDTRTLIDMQSIYDDIEAHISELEAQSTVVFKEAGKGLYPDVDATKLAGIAIGATKNEIAVIEGNFLMTNFDSSGGSPTQNSITIDFPAGYNKDNCIVKAFGTRLYNDGRGYNFGTGVYGNAGTIVTGAITRDIVLGYVADTSKIWMEVYNVGTSQRTCYYKIVLEKIA